MGSQTNEFRRRIEAVINDCSMENESDTPDFILADYLKNCLEAFDRAVNARRNWHSKESTKGWCEPKEQPVSPK